MDRNHKALQPTSGAGAARNRKESAGFFARAVLGPGSALGGAFGSRGRLGSARRPEYSIDLVRLVVDVPDTADSRQWMREFKGRWKTRLEQMELWMVSHPIEVE